ncbi:hypothetical protein GLOTRDRAFT_95088 [Gloeophyllum trabeum ATCC 11539]|uniref:CRIB domain-containing protein n=1 Tax=Gloeophyllum trabeum (strain ATCC 11539 / FP-39264 / Madison 617) TaxID=670483 RepID=S7Q0N3_GLOTA|nr:uncharacterized protein GLOTRDRAFT_95088 [Gloeophyllum trabeum ATCC 11539]EPQ53042.1 hypothetical protein GLOTRDRAFT_95088 [Gloeophyllum trabeum ATCC 11539]
MAQANSTGVQWLSNAEKRAIRNVLPSQAYKIMAAAHVKLYHARFTSLDWSYSGHQGVLVFGRNRRPPEVEDRREAEEEKYWFKMIDPHKERETWRHGIPRLFDYKQETPFWHTFGGESRTYGLRFEEDEEGSTFFRKVTTRVYPDDAQAATILRSRRRQKIHITSDDISSPIPGTFQHIVHMGPDGKGFAQPLQSFDPRLIDGLRRQGVSEKVLTKSMHFIQDFVSDCSRSTSEASRLTQSST